MPMAIAVAVLELETQTYTGQQDLVDIHGSNTAASIVELCANRCRRIDIESTWHRLPARRPEGIAELVAPARRTSHVAGDCRVFVRLQFPDVVGIHLFGEA